MAKVRIYQDIDCCLNASHNALAWKRADDTVNAGYCRGRVEPVHDDFGVRKEWPPGWDGYKTSYIMEWNSRLVDALNELEYDLVWATTWREDARTVGKLMGLKPRSERVMHPLSGVTTFPSISWKYSALIEDQIDNPGPFIWVEDEINGLPISVRNALSDMDGLLISPDPNLGVTPADVKRMKEFIERHND